MDLCVKFIVFFLLLCRGTAVEDGKVNRIFDLYGFLLYVINLLFIMVSFYQASIFGLGELSASASQ